jgi:hypothetical protein
LRALGLHGWGLWLGYLALALPALAAVLRVGLDRTAAISDVFATGILAAFFVSPYARHYDFPVLVIPLFVLLSRGVPRFAGAALLLVLLLVPYAQFIVLSQAKATVQPGQKFLLESSFYWVPLLLTAAWLWRFGAGAAEPVQQAKGTA